jgi:hypothetical protein
MSGVYSANNNQNAFVQQGRSTSRVLQPPGGASSFSIANGGPVETVQTRTRPQQASQEAPIPIVKSQLETSNVSATPISNADGVGTKPQHRPVYNIKNPPGGKSTFTLG